MPKPTPGAVPVAPVTRCQIIYSPVPLPASRCSTCGAMTRDLHQERRLIYHGDQVRQDRDWFGRKFCKNCCIWCNPPEPELPHAA
jgi:hypothetical protein